MSTFAATHVSVTIDRSPSDVRAYAADPRHLGEWAAGLGAARQDPDGRWLVDGPLGAVQVAFVDDPHHGVLDHVVTLPTGETFLNPMRAVPNGDGTELVFTVYRWDGTDDDAHRRDVAAVQADLATLRSVLEA